jgi:hypothetical protein
LIFDIRFSVCLIGSYQRGVSGRVRPHVLRGSVVALYAAAAAVFIAVLVTQLRTGTYSVETTQTLTSFEEWDCRPVAPLRGAGTTDERDHPSQWALNVLNVTRGECRAQLAALDPCAHATACNFSAFTTWSFAVHGMSSGAARLVEDPYDPGCRLRGMDADAADADTVAWTVSTRNPPPEPWFSERQRAECLEDVGLICNEIPEVFPPYQCKLYVPTPWWQAVVAAFLTSYLALHSLVLIASGPLWYVTDNHSGG